MPPLIQALRASYWGRALGADELARVAGEIVERAVPQGGYVCRKGEPVNHWIGVIEGLVKLGIVSAEGKPATLAGVPAGGWFGEGSLLKSEPRESGAAGAGKGRPAARRVRRRDGSGPGRAEEAMNGREHWTRKGDVRLFLWEKKAASQARGGFDTWHAYFTLPDPAYRA